MSCEMLIRRYISSLPRDQIFTTGEVLNCGPRAHVDLVMSMLVRNAEIYRLARGVFIRDDTRKPSLFEIASVKARRFGKEIVSDSANIMHKLGMNPRNSELRKFAVSGRTSSFAYGNVRILLKGVSGRKLKLADSKIGQTLRAMWYLGRSVCLHECDWDCLFACQLGARQQQTIREMVNRFGHKEFQELNVIAHLFPAWMTRFFFKMFNPEFQSPRRKSANSKGSAHTKRKEDSSENLRPNVRQRPAAISQSASRVRNEFVIRHNAGLRFWLDLFPLDRRIISRHPGKTFVFVFDHPGALDYARLRAREMEQIAAKYPELAPKQFYVSTEQLFAAISRLKAKLSERML